MKHQSKTKFDIRKNIDLPQETVAILDKLAADGRMPTKPFMERLLINFANDFKTKPKNNKP